MNIIAVGTLRENMVKAKFQALLEVKELELLLNVRDHPKIRPDHLIPESLSKTRFFYPSYFSQKIFGRVLPKFILTLKLLVKYRPAGIISCAIVPNGLICFLLSFFNVFWVHNLMNGKDEILLGPDHKNKILKNISREGFAGRNIENALKSILRKADHVTVMGRMSKKFVVEGIGISQEKVSIITGTVDLKRFNSTDRREEIYDIVMVSGLKPHKRIDRFIDTLVLLKKDIPGLRCVLIGGGEALKVLTETSEKKGLKGNLEFAGWVKHPEEYLKKSKVFVLTSDTEGLSKAMIEAMACGLPVVCTDVGDAKDIIISGETGYRVSSMAPEDISDAVVKLLRDDDIRRQMGKKAELLVEKEYSIVSEVDKWRALIRAASEKQQSRA